MASCYMPVSKGTARPRYHSSPLSFTIICLINMPAVLLLIGLYSAIALSQLTSAFLLPTASSTPYLGGTSATTGSLFRVHPDLGRRLLFSARHTRQKQPTSLMTDVMVFERNSSNDGTESDSVFGEPSLNASSAPEKEEERVLSLHTLEVPLQDDPGTYRDFLETYFKGSTLLRWHLGSVDTVKRVAHAEVVVVSPSNLRPPS